MAEGDKAERKWYHRFMGAVVTLLLSGVWGPVIIRWLYPEEVLTMRLSSKSDCPRPSNPNPKAFAVMTPDGRKRFEVPRGMRFQVESARVSISDHPSGRTVDMVVAVDAERTTNGNPRKISSEDGPVVLSTGGEELLVEPGDALCVVVNDVTPGSTGPIANGVTGSVTGRLWTKWPLLARLP